MTNPDPVTETTEAPGVPKSTAAALALRQGDEALLRSVLTRCHDGIVALRSVREHGEIVDLEWTVVNPAAEGLLARSADDLLGERMLATFPDGDHDALFAACVEVVETRRDHRIDVTLHADDVEVQLSCAVAPLVDGVSIAMHDTTRERQLQTELENRILRDPVTGLANRVLLEDRIGHAMANLSRRPGTLAVLFIDLERFKIVNDSLGHAAGDELLRSFSRRILAATRESDTIARFGGDEFVMLCEELPNDKAAGTIAHRIRSIWQHPFCIDGHQIRLTASIGVATTNVTREDPTSLIRDADAAMYRAKRNGGDSVEYFDESVRSTVLERLRTEVDLHRAIDEGELFVEYQPAIHCSTGRMVSVEALIRWNHPERGRLTPGDFLDVAGEAGLLCEIGSVVLETAARDLARMRLDLGTAAPPMVTVNLAAQQLTQANFTSFVLDLLERHGLVPPDLGVEVTETSLIRDPIAAATTLEELADAGVIVALDDFGTGFSALANLRRFPVHAIKIDGAFVAGVDQGAGDRALVDGVIALTQSLGKQVIAEGVETEAEREVLTELGCDFLQGWSIAKPMPLDDLLAHCEEHRPGPDDLPFPLFIETSRRYPESRLSAAPFEPIPQIPHR